MKENNKLNDRKFPILWTVYHTIIAVEILVLVVLQTVSVTLHLGSM